MRTRLPAWLIRDVRQTRKAVPVPAGREFFQSPFQQPTLPPRIRSVDTLVDEDVHLRQKFALRLVFDVPVPASERARITKPPNQSRQTTILAAARLLAFDFSAHGY